LVSLSVVIPAYNEESRLPASLDIILEFLATRPFSFWEVLVIDDGSRDGTAALAESYCATHPHVRLLRNPGNRGKGFAVRHGMLEAKGDWILSTDADLSTPIDEVDKLLAAAETSGAAVAIGSRALAGSLIQVHQSAFREYSGRFFNLIMRLVTGLPFRDTQCGFKLYRADAARRIFPRQRLDGFSFDVEDLFVARRLGFQTAEVPVRWSNVEGTKVGALQGLKSFVDLLKIRLNQLGGHYEEGKNDH
jgi:glycosyltransferase involved in cell wall biosynthesis